MSPVILIARLQVVWQTSSRRIRLRVIRKGSIQIRPSRPHLERLSSPPIFNQLFKNHRLNANITYTDPFVQRREIV